MAYTSTAAITGVACSASGSPGTVIVTLRGPVTSSATVSGASLHGPRSLSLTAASKLFWMMNPSVWNARDAVHASGEAAPSHTSGSGGVSMMTAAPWNVPVSASTPDAQYV